MRFVPRTLVAIGAAEAQGRHPGFSHDDLRKNVFGGYRERHAVDLVQHVATALPDVFGKVMLGMSVSAADAAKVEELAGLLAAANCRMVAKLEA